MQWLINKQRNERMKVSLPGHLVNIPGVKVLYDDYKTTRAEAGAIMFKDLQVNIVSEISPRQMLEIVRTLLEPAALGLTPLMAVQTLIEMRTGIMQLLRGDNMRKETYSHSFARKLPKAGPSGMDCGHSLSNKGKMNDSGRIEFVGVLPARNPILCLLAARGMGSVVRFGVLGEPVPDFTDAKDYFQRPVLRSTTSFKTAVSYKQQLDNLDKLFLFLGIKVSKKTHQGRAQGQRDLDELGVCWHAIARLAHYLHDAQMTSYLTNLPITALLGAAGYCIDFPRAAGAPHLAVVVQAVLLAMLAPWFEAAEAKVEDAITSCPTGKQVEEQQLYSASGALSYIKLSLKTLLQVAAARERDEEGNIMFDKQCMARQYPQNYVFKLPVFFSAEFVAFQKLSTGRSAQPAYIEHNTIEN